MTNLSPTVKFILQLAKTQAMLTRRFDRGLGGLGLSEFMILHYISQAPDDKLSRIDLAEKIGLTASGVTRILLPMEKIGLIKRVASDTDARISYVTLAPGGKRQLGESIERAELLAGDIIPQASHKKLGELGKLLNELNGTL